MEKFDMADLKRLIDLTEYLKRKYPDIDVEITVSEVASKDALSNEQLRRQEESLLSELWPLKKSLVRYENELEELEDNMPDPCLPEHIDWLMRSGDVEDMIDDLTGRITEIESELKGIRRLLARRRCNG